jgi:peptidoglycan/xylan/chitin deacetylase (PgdA/CDA1 family)
MTLRSQIGEIHRAVVSSFYCRQVPLGQRGPIITFTFDDFPRTAFKIGAPILESFGIRGTYYVAMSLINTQNDLGEQFRGEDLCSLVTRQHEIANHTFSHVSARRVGFDAFRKDVQRGYQAIQEIMGITPSGNFAYPYGEATLLAKKKLGPALTSARGTCRGLNGPYLDLNLLRANSLYGDIDRADVAKKLILQNEAQRLWLIFYSHDVSRTPSPYGCTPKLLESICSFASAHGARFMTVSEVIREHGQASEPCSCSESSRGASLLQETTNV